MSRGTASPKIQCPNCGSKVLVKCAKEITPTFREITYDCTNIHCQLRFVSTLTPVRIIAPPRNPLPDFHLKGLKDPKTKLA